MNALFPQPEPRLAEPPAWPGAERSFYLVRRLCVLYGLAALAALLATSVPMRLAIETRRSGLLGLVLGGLLIALAGLLATLPVAWARCRAGDDAVGHPTRRWAVLRRLRRSNPVDPWLRIGRMARRPQGIIVPVLAVCAAAASWWWRPAGGISADATLLGAGLIVSTFPLLVAERVMASVSAQSLPEAPGLQALLLVPVAILPLAGALELAVGTGAWWAHPAMSVVAAALVLIAAELMVRSLATWFLPPPAPGAARAAIGSFAALLLQPRRVAPKGLAAPIRTHLGIDFSRSWALRYLRGAAAPVAGLMLLLAWGLSGVALIGLDQRAVYERFGAPAAVWQPGAHVGLPWPLGRVRRVELGVVHAIPLGDAVMAATDAASAEDAAPPSADRLWDRAHPAEIDYLVASQGNAGDQTFQSVSLDLKLLYRFGLDDAAALRAAYATAAPEALVRAEAGRLVVRFFAGRTLPSLLGDDRETMADGLRRSLQSELDRLDSGIELVGVVIEAIHPPAAAASAYQNVQAAEIIATTAIATERGRALAAAAFARQESTDLTDRARGASAETVGAADIQLRQFTADSVAASGSGSFLLERYFTNLSVALAKSPLVIVDHRLGGADAPTIDLRSFGAPPAAGPADD